jgi:hypothetical protein
MCIKTEKFIEKSKLIHNNLYDYSKVNYISAKTKVLITCLEHGEFEQQPNNHLFGQGCFKCRNKNIGVSNTKSTNEFIERVKTIHKNKYNYSKVNYINAKTKVEIVCPKHGSFKQTPNDHLKGRECFKCGKIIQSISNTKSTNNFINQANKKHGLKRYDYSKVKYIRSDSNIIIICPKHGEFEQQPKSHLKGHDCPECANLKRSISSTSTTEKFIEKANKKHGLGKYIYSKVDYKEAKSIVKIICPKHGEFEQQSNNHLNGQGCPICNESKGEKGIRQFLENNKILHITQKKFNDCKNKKKLSFDFYLPDKNICIEYQGEQHYRPIKYFGGDKVFELYKFRDNIKRNYCQLKGIKLIEIKYNENILQKLNELL